jgi:hypothetical protein
MHSRLKSIVSSIQTATSGYFSPQPQSKKPFVNQSSPSSPSKMAPEQSSRRELFSGLVYYDSSSVLNDQHRKILANGGAVEYVPDGDVVDWRKITHVFTLALDFPGQQKAATQLGLVVVTVCVCSILTLAKMDRGDCNSECTAKVDSRLFLISSPKSFSPDPKMFFSGLVVTCAEVALSSEN